MTAEPSPAPGSPFHRALTDRHIRMEESEAARLALERYGEACSAIRLETEKDDTFRLDAAGGRHLILKVANPAEPVIEIDLEVSLLEHIAQRDPELPVPRVIPDTEGRSWAEMTDQSGQPRVVRLLTFLEGIPLDRMPTFAAQRREVGRVLARLRHAMVGFAHPGALRQLPWDVRHLQSLAPQAVAIRDRRRRADVERGLQRFAAIEPELDELRRQVLHNDFSKSNLIVDAHDHQRLAGVIDFGDAVWTAVAIDVATALLNQLPRELTAFDGDMFADGRDVLAGYLELADLTDEELALLPHLVMARVIARAIITHHRAELFPDNARYIMRNTEPGWAQLEWFLSRSPAEVSDVFRDRMYSPDSLERSGP